MSFELRPYQVDIISQVRAHMKAGIKSIVVTSPTGSGKTALTAAMLGTAAEKKCPSWFTVHRRELIRQSTRTFSMVGINHSIVAAGFVEDPRPIIKIGSVQTLARRYKKMAEPRLIIWDECFVAGTKVDGRPIESISVGDRVTAWDEDTRSLRVGTVSRLFINPAPPKLYRVSAGSQSVLCTGSHPFLLASGEWVQAKKLLKGDSVYGVSDMWGADEKESESETEMPELLQVSGNGCSEQKGRAATDAGEKSNVDERRMPEGERLPKKDRAPSKRQGREWTGASRAAEDSAGCARGRMDRGICCANEDGAREHISDALQVGLGEHGEDGLRRGGWGVTSGFRSTGAGQTERGVPRLSRVDSVEVLERGCDGEFERVCPDNRVYNLEVDGYHTYTANGFIVHNCHHIAAAGWAAIHAAFPNAFHVGLTATPERLDGKGLGKFFKVMVHGPSVAWLIENKYLSPYKIFVPPGISVAGLHTRMGDYVHSELEEAADKPTVTGDCIKHYQKYANGKRAVAFCVSIKHSLHVVEQFLAAGIPAEHVDGETDQGVRDAAIKRFESGETLVLSNVDLFGEGFDLPAIEAVILLRPTKSLGLYLQQVGRGLRVSPGKPHAVVLDHANNSGPHGLPDDERAWSLEGREGKSRGGATAALGVKVCKSCFAACRSGTTECANCGKVFEVEGREVEHADGELVEIDADALRRKRQKEVGDAGDDEASLVEIGKKRGYKNPFAWARHILIQRRQRFISEIE